LPRLFRRGLLPDYRPVRCRGQRFDRRKNSPDGNQVAYLDTGTNYLKQDNLAIIINNTSYTLTVWVGHRLDNPNPWPANTASIQLLANGQPIASLTLDDPGAGQWKRYSLPYLTGANDPHSGQQLGIQINESQSGPGFVQVHYDGITLFQGAVIIVCPEGSGDIHRASDGQTNLNGGMVWNGTEWVVNGTWGHRYFADLRVFVPPGKTHCTYEPARLKHYDNPQVFQGTSPTGLIATFGNYTVTRNIYTYRELAQAGNLYSNYIYEAVEYVIHYPAVLTGNTRNIILRSRGLGKGINEAFWDIYIEDDTAAAVPTQTTAFRGDPKWYTYPMTPAEAVNQTGATDYQTGDLPGALTMLGTRAADYFLDIANGSDMGPAAVGKSYEFHTSTLDPATTGTANLGSAFPIDFNLKWMDSSGNLQMLRFLPALVSETPQLSLYLPLILR
jgi:hypothetical protein